MTVSETYALVSRYPWYAAGIIDLCTGAKESSSMEAALELLRNSFVHLPDYDYAYFSLTSPAVDDFRDSSLNAKIKEEKKDIPSRVRLAGMDYFSREDYDSVKQAEDANLGKIAIVDYSAQENQNISEPSSSAVDIPEFVSETLAQIYIEQDHPEVAIEIYRKLSLESPEKNAYFAALIDKLKI